MGQGLGFGLDFPQRRLNASGVMTIKMPAPLFLFPTFFFFFLCSGETLIRDFILTMHMDENWKIIRY